MNWNDVFFAEGKDLGTIETIIRTTIIFIGTLAAVRIAKKRFLGRNTPFDVVLGVIVGSVASRAINGSAAFFQTVTAMLVLIAMHWIVSGIVSKSDKFGDIVEGKPALLVKNGKLDTNTLHSHHFRKDDFDESLRLKANTTDIKQVKEAYLETNGEISIIKE
ncbi:MAG: DUF421 domain-containing protein [Ignavibacteriaceae bacterium]